MTAKADPHHKADPVHHPARGASPMRLVILLAVLATVGGGWFYDYFVAAPGVKAANDKLHETVLQHNERGLPAGANAAKEGTVAASAETGGMLYSQDIQNILGMSPSWTKQEEFYTIECYRWWGWVPLDKHYITVLYTGDPSKRHYATHYVNEMPENDALPGINRGDAPVDLNAESANAEIAVPGGSGAPPPGPPGPPSAGPPGEKKGGKGSKGRPQAKGETTADARKGNEAKGDSPKGDEVKEDSSAKDSDKTEPAKEESSNDKPKPKDEEK